jgi:hypothetical protein
MGPTTIALALLLAVLVLVPMRRLALSGTSRLTLTLYFVVLWGLSLVVVAARGPRILIPVLLIAYLLPFVTLGAGLEAIRRRFGARPVKDVTPVEEPRPPSG